jgi:cell division protein FtsW (lipid II flippase)
MRHNPTKYAVDDQDKTAMGIKADVYVSKKWRPLKRRSLKSSSYCNAAALHLSKQAAVYLFWWDYKWLEKNRAGIIVLILVGVALMVPIFRGKVKGPTHWRKQK